MEFSERLKQARESKGWTQAKLASRASISREYLARLEAGKQDPTLSVVRRIVKALGIGLGKFLA